MTAFSPQVFIVVDPPQDYEESLKILGVHGSLQAAKVATRGYRRRKLPPTGPAGIPWPLVSPERNVEVQLWQGDRLLGTWTHSGESEYRPAGVWTYQPGPDERAAARGQPSAGAPV